MKPVSTQLGTKTRFIKLKVGLALFLAALFYFFAAAAVGGLLWAGLAVGQGSLSHLGGRLMMLGLLVALSLVAAALVIAWSVLPRFDRFEPPGPVLSPAQHPDLFAEIAHVAERAGQAPPSQVYLVAEPNAFVTQRGGIVGLFSRRVMGVGLALLNVLSVSELRSVLAHEFGHFAGGDTRLGPWLHKARGALVRTVANLQGAAERSSGASELGWLAIVFSAINAPFRWYALLFLRMTQSLSRTQEFAADALAVRLEGQAAFVNGLARSRDAGVMWSIYLEKEVLPVLDQRALPPLGSGFQAFLGAPRIAQVLSQLQAQAEHETVDPYDSHPPFAQRVAHAEAIGGARHASDDRRAIELLHDVPRVEAALAAAWVEGEVSATTWSATGELLAQNWDENLKESEVLLSGMTPETVPLTEEEMVRLARARLPADVLSQLEPHAQPSLVTSVFSLALSALLRRHGFEVHNAPGESLWLVRGDEMVQPDVMLGQCVAGKLSPEAWRAHWAALGVMDSPLST